MVKGLEKIQEFFRGFEAGYTLVGGTASLSAILLDEDYKKYIVAHTPHSHAAWHEFQCLKPSECCEGF